ncbi:imidazolonepropionase [Thalassoglobus neptunius]|uniref:Imidazolonepropionase n=2 Tax=Thalassoglobus neptunius TaxID=1938619 RepID=A0A5C5X7B4_9PLAN|nr:imidazolonepropionase [Thalassoglobus neptunius]
MKRNLMIRIRPFLCAGVAAVLSVSVALRASDEIPGGPQQSPIALIGADLYPVSQPPIPNGVILFEKGKITAVGPAREIAIPANTQRISLAGKRIYPSLIESHSILGLVEIPAVRASRDQRETGSINPNVRAAAAVNPDSELIPVARANGVLLALSAPEGGFVSGQASMLQLDGWTSEDLALEPSVGMIVNWPSVKNDLKESSNDHDRVDELRELLDEARAYRAGRISDRSRQQTDLKLEALRPVIDRQIPILVWADSASVIQSAVAFALEQNIRIVILGGYDAPVCADLLKKHKVPVVISAVYRLPRRRNDPFDSAYTLPARLHEAGVSFAISGSASSRSSSNSRNLPYHAGVAVAYGLPEDEALKAITLSPAEIFGIEDRVGSLDVGKDATLIVTDGDPLETPTSVTHAWIQGRSVELTSRHTRLYEKYQQKYRQLGNQ